MNQLNRKIVKETPSAYLIASLIGFFMLAWAGLVLAPLCLFLINKTCKAIITENFSFLKWFLWFWVGFLISLVHLINYQGSLLFSEETGFSSQNSVKRIMSAIVRECEVKKYSGDKNPSFVVPELTEYLISPKNGSCNGDDLGQIRAIRNQSPIYFNWWNFTSYNPLPSKSLPKEIIYNVETGVKSCIPGEKDHFCIIGGW